MSNHADATREDHRGLMVPEKVRKLPVVFGIVNHEIGNLAGFERSNFSGPVQAAGGVDSSRSQIPQQDVIFICVQASDITILMEVVGEEPGLKSVARTIASPASIIVPRCRILMRADGIYGSGQKDRLNAGDLEGRNRCGLRSVRDDRRSRHPTQPQDHSPRKM